MKSIVVVDSGDPDYHALWRLTVDGSADPVRLTPKRNFCAGRPSAAPGPAVLAQHGHGPGEFGGGEIPEYLFEGDIE